MVTVSFLPGFPFFSFSSHSQGSRLDHKSDSALPFQTTHRLLTVLGTQPELLAQDPSRLTQTSLSDLLCPLLTVFYSSLLAHLLPGHQARDTAWPLNYVAHVSNVLSPISCQENSYSSFKTQLRQTFLWEVFLAAYAWARDIYLYSTWCTGTELSAHLSLCLTVSPHPICLCPLRVWPRPRPNPANLD